jgi:hypothetical protein
VVELTLKPDLGLKLRHESFLRILKSSRIEKLIGSSEGVYTRFEGGFFFLIQSGAR